MTGPATTGVLHGVGVGPGDPELVTVRAARLISAAAVVAYHAGRPGSSLARACAAPYLREDQVEEELVYPVTRGRTDHPGGYAGAIDEFYAEAAERLAGHLAAGRDVVLLAEGDPTLFSSFAHMLRRLEGRFRCEITPGITSVSAAAAAARTPLVEADEVLSILSATRAEPELAEWIDRSDALAFLKVSRNLAGIRAALEQEGRLDDAVLVSEASRPGSTVQPLADVDPSTVPYMSAVLVPGAVANRSETARRGRVTVIGLGPGGPEWLTPETASVLRSAQDLVGYRTYIDRVPQRAGQLRHSSDNRVEAERAEFALSLARRGRRVAVVSSGDPGVFGMATAVLEVQEAAGYDDVDVRVVPGLTAANAVAARVGAPLGHDYCVISLSDQLKPWPVVLRRLEAAAAGDMVLALYNTGSRTRRGHIADVVAAVAPHRPPGTPVVVARAVGDPDAESVRVISLDRLGADDVDMRTMLIIGSSVTRWNRETGVVFTPRRYAAADTCP